MALVSSLDEIRSGLSLGRYECLTPIARGGMAAVWSGRVRGARGFERLVAIKTILPALSDDPEFVSMFLDEARLAAMIRHPNVASVLDLGEHGGAMFLVLEWIEGEPLSAVLRESLAQKAPLPLGVVGRVMIDLCAGLQSAHELCDGQGRLLELVHRDVSPQNVMLSLDGQVKLVDFGVAKATARSSPETAPGVLKGKAGYVAPEQALGLPIDRRADLFAVGVLLYQMVSGKHPFRGEHEMATLANVVARTPPLPSQAADRPLPPGLDAVVMKALQRRPTDRFESAAEMASAIEKVLGEPLATNVQVGQLVQSLVGARCEERRRTLRATIRELDARRERVTIDPPPLPPVVPSDDSAPRSVEGVETLAPPPVSARSSVGPVPAPVEREVTAVRARWRWWGLAPLIAVGALVAVWAVRTTRPAEPSTDHAPASNAVSAAPVAPVLSASASASPILLARPPASAVPSVSAARVAPAVPPKRVRTDPKGQGRWAQPVPNPGF